MQPALASLASMSIPHYNRITFARWQHSSVKFTVNEIENLRLLVTCMTFARRQHCSFTLLILFGTIRYLARTTIAEPEVPERDDV